MIRGIDLDVLQLKPAAIASACGAVVTRDVAIEYLGMPLPVLLAAFAGAGLILSFLPVRTDAAGVQLGRGRTLGTVVFCTLLSAYTASRLTAWLAGQVSVFDHADIMVAFVMAALWQVTIPIAIADPKGTWQTLVAWLPGRRS